MEVRLAKSAGFCFGVSRAVETVEKAAVEYQNVVTLGPIIHNRHVLQRFEGMGVQVISSPVWRFLPQCRCSLPSAQR